MPKLNSFGSAGLRLRVYLLPFFALGLLSAGPALARITPVEESCALELESAPESAPVVTATDEAKLKNFCDTHHLTLELMAPVTNALAYRPRTGYRAKPAELKKCRSLKKGPNAGLVACPPDLFADHASWYGEIQRLGLLGFQIMADEDFLVRDASGELFFSDYDLLGVWDASGRNAYDENLRAELNRSLGRELIMHGPLAIYEHRQSVGLKFPVRIFTDGRRPITVYTEGDLRRLEAERRIPWAWP